MGGRRGRDDLIHCKASSGAVSPNYIGGDEVDAAYRRSQIGVYVGLRGLLALICRSKIGRNVRLNRWQLHYRMLRCARQLTVVTFDFAPN